MFQKRGSCRGAQFPFDFSAVCRDPAQDPGSRRGRNGENAMGTFDLPASHMDGRSDHLIRRKLMHEHTNRGYVGDGVHSPDFMEMNVCDRNAVDMAFSLCDQLVNAENILSYLLR